jgi:hypothetical protein
MRSVPNAAVMFVTYEIVSDWLHNQADKPLGVAFDFLPNMATKLAPLKIEIKNPLKKAAAVKVTTSAAPAAGSKKKDEHPLIDNVHPGP